MASRNRPQLAWTKKMFRLLRKIAEEKIAAAAHLYFSADLVVVAPVHRNLEGIYFEQTDAAKLLLAPTDAEVGLEFRKAFESFSVRDKNLRDLRKTDWPAFRASTLKSVKAFEGLYRPVRCYSQNNSNIIVRASTPHAALADIELSTSFNPHLDTEVVGRLLLSLVKAANATRADAAAVSR